MKKIAYCLIVCFSISKATYPQDLMDMLDEEVGEETLYSIATFKSTRVVTGHSIETVAKNHLDFRISHRFGNLNAGFVNAYGLDEANIRIGLEYGVTDRIMVGFGRSNSPKNFDFFAKGKILRQSSGASEMPVSLTYVTSATIDADLWSAYGYNFDETFARRLKYAHQLLVARKVNESISVQFMPSFVHKNLAQNAGEPNNIYAVGMGGRMKLTNRITFNVEYYLLDSDTRKHFNDPLSLGFDIETGGHVFQLFLSNSLGMLEPYFIGATDGRWLDGDIRFGFNISRIFSLEKKEDATW